MNKERMNHLIEILENVKPALFDLRQWACDSKDYDAEPSLDIFVEKDGILSIKEGSCGFAGCAGGWACLDPEFQKQGLHFEHWQQEYWVPKFEDWPIGYLSIAAFFGISHDESIDLFSPEAYKSGNPKVATVVKRIKKLMDEHL